MAELAAAMSVIAAATATTYVSPSASQSWSKLAVIPSTGASR